MFTTTLRWYLWGLFQVSCFERGGQERRGAEHWLVIGQFWSRDLNTGLWLAAESGAGQGWARGRAASVWHKQARGSQRQALKYVNIDIPVTPKHGEIYSPWMKIETKYLWLYVRKVFRGIQSRTNSSLMQRETSIFYSHLGKMGLFGWEGYLNYLSKRISTHVRRQTGVTVKTW